MSTCVAHDLNNDNDLIHCDWFGSEEEMSAALKTMTANGWIPGEHGLVSVTEHGVRCVARPMKIKGNLVNTGIGIWRMSDEGET